MNERHQFTETHSASLAELRLLHLADSAFPIGSLAHSFGLETLVDSGRLTVADLPAFFQGYLEEAGVLEAAFCREAHRLADDAGGNFPADRWLQCNDRLSALKPGREARAGSAVLGENLLSITLAVENLPIVRLALEAARELRDGRRTSVQHSLAFGLVAGALGIEAERAAFAFLHQSVTSLVSACQRLMPLGQTGATRILWNLKPLVLSAATRSAECNVEEACCFTPLFDWGAMEHTALTTRLFIS
jgi:urease accessory protein